MSGFVKMKDNLVYLRSCVIYRILTTIRLKTTDILEWRTKFRYLYLMDDRSKKILREKVASRIRSNRSIEETIGEELSSTERFIKLYASLCKNQ